MQSIIKIIILAISLQVAAESVNPAAQQMQVTPLQSFDPSAQIQPLKGYQLRLRKIVVPAGVSIGEHEHRLRPGIVYVESGYIVEYRGTVSKRLKPGDSLVEDVATVHSYKNTSDEDCVLIAFDLPQIETQSN